MSQSQPRLDLRDVALARSSGVLIVRVAGDTNPPRSPWRQGPFPWPLPPTDGKYIFRDTADERTRSEFFEARIRPLLYGNVRWHRDAPADLRLGQWPVTASELLRYPDSYGPPGALLIIHVSLECDDLASAASAVSRLANMRPVRSQDDSNLEEVTRAVGALLPGVAVVFQRTAYVVSHLTTVNGLADHEQLADVPHVAAPHAAARLLASANEADALPGSLQHPELGIQDITVSASWVAAVLRTGCAFVGRTPERGDDFHSMAEVHVHSLYLDAILVGLLQRDCIEERTNGLVTTWESKARVKDIARQERLIIQLRGQAWWLEISQAENPNRLLGALQTQYRLPDQLERLNRDVMDLARITDAARQERTNRLLNILVVASAALGFAALIADPGRAAVIWGVGLALVAWLVIVLAGRDRP